MAWAASHIGFFAASVCIALMASAPPARADQVILGAEDDAAPWSYADGSGYVNDLVKAVFREVGWDLQFKVMPYSRCKALAIAGKLPGCFSSSKTAELESALLYSKAPVVSARNLLIARADSKRSGCAPTVWAAPTRIGLVRDYEYSAAVTALDQRGMVTIDYAESEISNLRKLQAGRIDVAMVMVDEVKRLDYLERLAQTSVNFKTVCDFGAMPAYVTFSRLHAQGAAARAAFDEGYGRLVKRGAIRDLQSAWRGRALDAAVVKPH